MIIVRLSGGLGNQMFQYAAGRRLAATLDVPLKLDVFDFRHDPRRDYALDKFAVEADMATMPEIRKLGCRPLPFWQKIVGLSQFNKPERGSSCMVEKSFSFDPAILALGDNVYLDGYWQSEKYFIDLYSLIRQDFQVVKPLVGDNAALAKEIQTTKAVSVHVRRGDYAYDEAVQSIHGLCDVSYYQNCAEAILDCCGEVCFYVFSDEPDWVRRHLSLPGNMVVVDHNGPGEVHEDLRLMSLCHHHIIANSSLSWWGAWLRQNPDGYVYAPEQWFADSTIDTGDLLPKTWQRRGVTPS